MKVDRITFKNQHETLVLHGLSEEEIAIVLGPPLIRGTIEWSEREGIRQKAGNSCLAPRPILPGRAHGEHSYSRSCS